MTSYSPKLQVSFDTYQVLPQGRITRAVELRNVMAILPGRSARRIYVSGHYDTLARPGGRIGRMFVTLMAQQLRIVELPLLHISAQMENIKNEYLERLFAVSKKSDWLGWINFFLEVLEKSSRNSIRVVDKIIALQAEFTKHVLANGKSPRLRTIIDELFTRGWITVVETQKLCGVTFPTAQSDLRELVDLNILIEDDGKRPAIYWSVEIRALSERGIYV